MKPIEKFDNVITENLAIELENLLQKDYPNCKFQRCIEIKNNDTKIEGIYLTGQGAGVSPNIYLTDMAKRIENFSIGEKEAVLKLYTDYKISNHLKPDISDVMQQLNPDNIYLEVINKDWNKEKISSGPYQDIEGTDLVFVARLRLDDNASIYVTNNLCSQLGLTGSEVMNIGRENSLNKENWTVTDMKDIIFQEMGIDNLPEEIKEEMMLQMESSEPMIVITNEKRNSIAGLFLDSDIGKEISERLGLEECESFYILPSSIYECIAIPAKVPYDDAVEMVRSININEVSEQERLSDNVFICNSVASILK